MSEEELVSKKDLIRIMQEHYQALAALIDDCKLGPSRSVSLAITYLEDSFLRLREAIELFEPTEDDNGG